MKFIMIMKWYDYRINYFNLKGMYYFIAEFFFWNNQGEMRLVSLICVPGRFGL